MKEALLRTLAYADAADMPLTSYEAWQYCINGDLKLGEVIGALDILAREGKLVEKFGYYTFPDRALLTQERLERLQINTLKLKRAQRWARYLVRLPYVRGVFAYGSLATGNTKKDSDLDVLIVTAPGRIFTARILVTWFTELFGVRRTRTAVKDRICLNHYVTEEVLGVPEAYRNLPTAWLWSRMFPLALRRGSGQALQMRFEEENSWVDEWFPNIERVQASKVGRASRVRKETLHALPLYRLSDPIERLLRYFQLRRIRKNPLTYKEGGRVVANDTMLIFHPELPEARRMERYRTRLARLGISLIR